MGRELIADTLALRSHGLDVDPQLVDRGEFTFDSGLAGQPFLTPQ